MRSIHRAAISIGVEEKDALWFRRVAHRAKIDTRLPIRAFQEGANLRAHDCRRRLERFTLPRRRKELTAADFVKGLVKATVFGVLVAIAGCLRGIQSGRSSEAVGLAATSAVVTGIVFIIVADAVLTVIYHVLGV